MTRRPVAVTTLLCLLASGSRHSVASARQAEPRAQKIWSGQGIDRSGSLSYDGRYLSYTDPRTGDLGVLDLTSGASRGLTQTGGWSATMEGHSVSSVLSSDGRHVAYVWNRARAGYEVRVLPVDGSGGPRVIMMPPAATHYLELAGWTPDNTHLVAIQMLDHRSSRIVLVSVDNGAMRPIKSLGHHYPRNVSLSPDGRYIACDVPGTARILDIIVLTADGSRETTVVQDAAEDSGPIWSPDGSRLVFFSDRGGTGSLWTIPMHEGKPTGPAQLLEKETGRVDLLGLTRAGTLYYVAGGPSQKRPAC